MASTTISPRRLARIAGLFYVIIIACGIWSEFSVRLFQINRGDVAETATNVALHEATFRLALAADTVMAISDVALAVLLYVLLRPAGTVLSLMAMTFRLVQAAVIGASLLFYLAGILVVTGPWGLDLEDREGLAGLAFEIHAHGYDLGLVFFGVACVLLGLLVWRSGFLPRWLGALVIATGPVYLVGSFLRFLAPDAASAFEPAYLLPLVAETAFALWLLVRGVNEEAWRAAALPRPD